MKLIPRHRQQRARAAHIAVTNEEIAADIHYPAPPPKARRAAAAKRVAGR